MHSTCIIYPPEADIFKSTSTNIIKVGPFLKIHNYTYTCMHVCIIKVLNLIKSKTWLLTAPLTNFMHGYYFAECRYYHCIIYHDHDNPTILSII